MNSIGTEKLFRLALYLVAIVLINIAGISLFFRIDLTANNKYSLSSVSREAVSSLSEPLTIKAFFSQDLPSKYNTTQRYLRDLLKEYAIHSNENFNYKFYKVNPNSDKNVQKARSYGISPVKVRVIQEAEVKYKTAYMGLVLIHGDTVEKIPTIGSRERLEYKLTSAMENLKNKVSALLNLKEKVQVKLYLSPQLKRLGPKLGIDKLPEFPSRLKSIVSELNSENYQKLEFKQVQTDHSMDLDSLEEEYQLQNLQWPSLPERNIKKGSGLVGIVIEHKDKSKTVSPVNVSSIPLVGTQYNLMGRKRLQENINSQLKTLLDINQNLGYLTNAGTLNLTSMSGMRRRGGSSASSFQKLVKNSYNLKKIDLNKGIPEGLQTLVIAGPKEEFSKYQLYQIDQALMRGTNLAVFMDKYKKQDGKSQNKLRRSRQGVSQFDTGLEKLLNHYGIDVKDAIVLDENCYEQRLSRSRRSNRGGTQPIYYAPIIKNKNINHQPKFMQNITRLVGIKCSPVSIKNATVKKNSLQAYRLFSSSGKSWTMQGRNVRFNPYLSTPPKDSSTQHKRPLAYYLTGKFDSYFQGKNIPEQPRNATSSGKKQADTLAGKNASSGLKAVGSKTNKSEEASIFVLGSSHMLSNTVIDPQGKSPNSIFTMNVLDALNNRTDMAKLRAKTQEFVPLPELSAATRSVIKLFNIIGLPILVFIFGLLVWIFRNRRKKTIRARFSA